jgi:Tfp pilus assembly protein PilF
MNDLRADQTDTTGTARREGARRYLRGLAWLLAAAALMAVYGTALRGEYLWDDIPLVRDNPLLRGLHGLARIFTTDLWGGATGGSMPIYRPLPMASLWLQALLTDRSLVAFRVGNLLLHGACAGLLYAWIRRDGVRPGIAALCALAFALHPSATEVVLWVVGRHDSLGAVFALAGLLAWCRREPTTRSDLVAAFACACAFASKESYAIVPALLAITLRSGQASLTTRAIIRRAGRLAPVVGAVLGVFAVRAALGIASSNDQVTAPLAEHLVHYGTLLVHYFVQVTSFTTGTTIQTYRPLPARQALAAIGLVVACIAPLALAWRRGWTRAGKALFGVGWFLLALVPHAVSLPLFGLYGNRYAYFPMMGLAVALAHGLAALDARWPATSRWMLPLVASLLVIPALRSATASAHWRDDLTLYGDDLSRRPTDGRVLYHYGYAVWRRRGCPAAVPWFARAARFAPDEPHAWHNLTTCLIELGHPADAIAPARHALALDPTNAKNYYNLGVALLGAGQGAAGIVALRRAIALDPGTEVARRAVSAIRAATPPPMTPPRSTATRD